MKVSVSATVAEKCKYGQVSYTGMFQLTSSSDIEA